MDRKEYMKEYMKKKRAEKNLPEQTKPVGYIREEVPVEEKMPPSVYHQTPEEFNAKVEAVVRGMMNHDLMFKSLFDQQDVMAKLFEALLTYLSIDKGNWNKDIRFKIGEYMKGRDSMTQTRDDYYEDDVPL